MLHRLCSCAKRLLEPGTPMDLKFIKGWTEVTCADCGRVWFVYREAPYFTARTWLAFYWLSPGAFVSARVHDLLKVLQEFGLSKEALLRAFLIPAILCECIWGSNVSLIILSIILGVVSRNPKTFSIEDETINITLTSLILSLVVMYQISSNTILAVLHVLARDAGHLLTDFLNIVVSTLILSPSYPKKQVKNPRLVPTHT